MLGPRASPATSLPISLASASPSATSTCCCAARWRAGSSPRARGPDAAILGLGVLYLLLQTFLSGGLLATFRSNGGWTVRGLAHAGGFYFGRLFRVSLLALAAAGLVFALDAPLAARLDGLARHAVSERSALALTLGRHGLLLLALLLVHMVASYAKVIVVAEERRSALLAFVSSVGFCAPATSPRSSASTRSSSASACCCSASSPSRTRASTSWAGRPSSSRWRSSSSSWPPASRCGWGCSRPSSRCGARRRDNPGSDRV